MSYCAQLATWTQAHANELSGYGSYLLSVSDDDREKASAHLTLEATAVFVELLLWDSGEAEVAFGPFDAATEEHHELRDRRDLDALLTRFLRQAEELTAS